MSCCCLACPLQWFVFHRIYTFFLRLLFAFTNSKLQPFLSHEHSWKSPFDQHYTVFLPLNALKMNQSNRHPPVYSPRSVNHFRLGFGLVIDSIRQVFLGVLGQAYQIKISSYQLFIFLMDSNFDKVGHLGCWIQVFREAKGSCQSLPTTFNCSINDSWDPTLCL